MKTPSYYFSILMHIFDQFIIDYEVIKYNKASKYVSDKIHRPLIWFFKQCQEFSSRGIRKTNLHCT